MFGYIKAYQPELKVSELEVYKAVYCTLCRSLGRHYGLLARMTLSYDFTFMALVGLSVRETCPGYRKRRCAFNPLVRCQTCQDETEVFPYVAACAMMLLYYKARDNVEDSRGLKRLGYRLVSPLFRPACRKAGKRYPQALAAVQRYIADQHVLEADKSDRVDRAAQPTAELLGTLFAEMGEGESAGRVLKHMGYCVGKWVYLADAADDLEQDRQTDNYNVLLRGADNAEPDEALRERAYAVMRVCIDEAGRAAELLDCKRYGTIIHNILYFGMARAVSADKELNQ